MKIKSVYSLFFLLVTTPLLAHPVVTYIGSHSPSNNSVYHLLYYQQQLYAPTCSWSFGQVTVTHTFQSDRIAQCLFGKEFLNCENQLHIVGSQVQRLETDWLADYFGLPTDFESFVQLNPKMSSAWFDLQFFARLDEEKRWFFLIHLPLVYTRWDLNICECVIDKGENNYDSGYFNTTGVDRDQLLKNFTSFAIGQVPVLGDEVTFQPLNHAKICTHAQKRFSPAEIECCIGYDFPSYKCITGRLYGSLFIPAGNKPKGNFVFEPIVGNGHHWAVALGGSTFVDVWYCNENEYARVWADLSISHLFKTTQKRTFDLCGKPNSRYMLAAHYTENTQNLLVAHNSGFAVPFAQFANTFTPVANLTTLQVSVSTPVQIDFSLMLAYTQNCFTYNMGYAFWFRSCDSLTLCNVPWKNEHWALKGDAALFGFDAITEIPSALSATQSQATIAYGKNFPPTGAYNSTLVNNGKTNPRIDNPALAFAGNGNTLTADPGGVDQINSSFQPFFILPQHIALDSAKNKGISHSLFSQIDYVIQGKHRIAQLNIGAQVEFGAPDSPCKENKDDCINCAFTFWSVWIKAGLSFG